MSNERVRQNAHIKWIKLTRMQTTLRDRWKVM